MHPFASTCDRLAVEFDFSKLEEAPNLTECLDGVDRPLLVGIIAQTGFSAAVQPRVGTVVESVEQQVERAVGAAAK